MAEVYLDRTFACPGETLYLSAKIWNYKYSRSFPKAVVKFIQVHDEKKRKEQFLRWEFNYTFITFSGLLNLVHDFYGRKT